MTGLEQTLGYTFRDPELLTRALTHSSYLNEHHMEKFECNERLEFLGDSILEFVSSEFLYKMFREEMEGSLSQKRASLVCEDGLCVSAHEIGLGSYLILGKGAEKEGSRSNAAVLSDAFEALIAAIYLDGGLEPARKLIYDHVLNDIEEKLMEKDSKTTLQELLQNRGAHAVYETVEETGPDHEKDFRVVCLINNTPVSEGTGRTKKSAEKAAAARAIDRIRNGSICI